MKSLAEIRQQIVSGNFELTRHALRRVVERNISRLEIMEIGSDAIIIEDYPDDKYSPSCLILGFTANQRPLHIQVSCLASDVLMIITIYEPNDQEWIKFTRRR
jgi:hypothetical protein